jgi:hypothetical protein
MAFLGGIGRKSFDTNVRPHIRERKIGRRVFYYWEDLERWLETKGTSASTGTTTESIMSGFGTRGTAQTSRRAREIAQKLVSGPHVSMPKLCRADEHRREKDPRSR